MQSAVFFSSAGLLFIVGLATFVAAISPRLVYLGQYGAKKYYSDEGPYTWSTARQICERDGLTLIDVESDEEAAYLLTVLPHSKNYWTAGKEAYFKFYEWYDSVNTGKRLPSLTGGGSAPQNCAAFARRSDDRVNRVLTACATFFPVLCQDSPNIPIRSQAEAVNSDTRYDDASGDENRIVDHVDQVNLN